ncbi:MAG: hypothetical protein H6731_10050 [Myxococcales bacterium]|nr:MAG: hypothetical protein H6731_10050 [Myxococcales bacterium]
MIFNVGNLYASNHAHSEGASIPVPDFSCITCKPVVLSEMPGFPGCLKIPKAGSTIKKKSSKKSSKILRFGATALHVNLQTDKVKKICDENFANLTTGFSPARTAPRSICLGSPLQELTNPKVYLQKSPRVKKKLDFNLDEDAQTHLQAQIIDSTKTDFHIGTWAPFFFFSVSYF